MPVSALRVIILADLLSNTCLYELNLGGNEVLYKEFNKTFLLLFVAILGTVTNRHYVNPSFIPSILLSIVSFYLCPGALELQFTPLWLPRPCVQKYLSKICRHWVTRFSSAISCGRSRGYVGIIHVTFTAVIGKKSHWLLVMRKNCCTISAVLVEIGGAGSFGGGGNCLSYLPDVEVWRKGSLQCIQRG